VNIRGTDQAGQTTTPQSTGYEVDTTPPTFSSSLSPGSSITTSTTTGPHFSFAASDGSGSGIDRIEYRITDVTSSSVIRNWTTVAVGSTALQPSGLSLIPGNTYQIQIKAIDLAGNESISNLTATWSVAAPTLVITTSSGTVSVGALFSATVELQDGHGNQLTSASSTVQLQAFSDAQCTVSASGNLSGSTVVAAAGAAQFSSLQFDTSGTVYLKASSAGYAIDCSPAFTITPSFTVVGVNVNDFVGDPNPSDNNFHGIVAYSVRRVVDPAIYSGPLFRAVRAGDNQELDFGANESSIDTNALQTWITGGGGTTAKIRTWYDQSGNQEHLHQTTVAYQPELVSNCASGNASPFPCIKYSGWNTLKFNDASSTSGLRLSSTGGIGIFAALKFAASSSHINFVLSANHRNNYVMQQWSGGWFTGTWDSSEVYPISDFPPNNTWFIRSAVEKQSNAGTTFYRNGSQVGTRANFISNVGDQIMDEIGCESLGFGSNPAVYNQFSISELIVINNGIVTDSGTNFAVHTQIVNNQMARFNP